MRIDLGTSYSLWSCESKKLKANSAQQIGNLDFLQQAFDLRAAQAALGIGEHAARGFKML